MPAYIIATADVTDPAAYEEYKRLSGIAVQAHGAVFRVRGGPVDVLEGDWQPPRVAVLEFPDRAAARAFYEGPEYTAARAARAGAARMSIIIVDGV
ncbi:DUF1330 domain-containing protein [Azospirillum halopraeferens]|uniref:DUF1330 domain-containing protein n=1 Tax=Azospirillum halopraeferens TaxID=34010 RepID=UPI0004024707|nr:DUF1330 domain-containing protein [Azospirillum halopraeferens]